MTHRLSFIPADTSHVATTRVGMACSAVATSPAGGVGTLPLDGAGGAPAVLITNPGSRAVLCRWDRRIPGPAATGVEFEVPPGGAVARTIPAAVAVPAVDGDATATYAAVAIAFHAVGHAASLGVVFGRTEASFSLGEIDGRPALAG